MIWKDLKCRKNGLHVAMDNSNSSHMHYSLSLYSNLGFLKQIKPILHAISQTLINFPVFQNREIIIDNDHEYIAIVTTPLGIGSQMSMCYKENLLEEPARAKDGIQSS